MKKRILFLTGSGGREVWMWKLSQEMMKNEDIQPFFLAVNQQIVDYLTSVNVPEESIIKIFAFSEKSELNTKFLRDCEKKYDFNIWDAWSTSSFRNKNRAKWKVRDVLGYFQYIIEKMEKMISTVKPDYYVCVGPAGATHVVQYKMFLHHKIPIVELKSGPLPNNFTILNNFSNTSPTLKENYSKIIKEGLTEKEKKIAKQFIDDFQNKPKKPDCVRKFSEPTNKKIKRYLSYIYKFSKYRNIPNLSFLFWPFMQKVYDNIGVFEKIQNEKYMVFPLHVQPEASTLIYGKWYLDQASLIENISKSIPLSHMLYVKEHKSRYGNRGMEFYKRIKRLPNVKLISPHEDNFNLMKNCSLLFTITGTAGWEAALLQKPTIVFGKTFYNIFSETNNVEKIEDLPEMIRKNLDKKIDHDKLVEFVAAIMNSSYPGLARLPVNCKEHSLSDENVKLLSEGIIKHINI